MLTLTLAAFLSVAAPADAMSPAEVAKLYAWMMSDDPLAKNILCQPGKDIELQGRAMHTMVCVTGPASGNEHSQDQGNGA